MKNFFIVILTLLVLGLGGFVFYDKLMVEDKKEVASEEKKEEPNNENLDYMVSAIANDLLTTVSIGILSNAYQFEFNETNKLTYNELSEEERINMAYQNLFGKAPQYSLLDSIKKTDLESSYRQIFGIENFTLPNKINTNQCISYQLNGEFYKATANGCGLTFTSKYILDESKLENNNITFTAYLAYITRSEDINDNSSYLVNNIENQSLKIKVDNNDFENENTIRIINENKDKLLKYKFTFKPYNTYYAFESVELINN